MEKRIVKISKESNIEIKNKLASYIDKKFSRLKFNLIYYKDCNSVNAQNKRNVLEGYNNMLKSIYHE